MEVNYDNYRAEDFLEDADFIAWVKYRPAALENFWSEWRASQPDNLTAFQEAERQLRLILSAERIEPSQGDREDVLHKIFSSIDRVEEVVPLRSGVRRWMIASSVAAVLIISVGLWFVTPRKNATAEFAAAYGEIRKIVLPDQSMVTLNANSHISFKRDWNPDKAREIWLEGEANFNVKHLNNHGTPVKESERFIIHTKLSQIEVLGTVFNVKERRGKVEVSLETGSVKVQVKAVNNTPLVLKPGEVFMYDHTTKAMQRILQDPAVYKAWTEKKILANNTTVGEIIQDIEDHYGHEIILEDADLANRAIDGTLPFTSESNVLFVLSNILDIDIERKDSTLIFKSRKQVIK